MFICLTGAIAIDGSQFSDTSDTVLVSAVNCSGMESSLSDCSYETSPTTCNEGGVAGVVCQGMFDEPAV